MRTIVDYLVLVTSASLLVRTPLLANAQETRVLKRGAANKRCSPGSAARITSLEANTVDTVSICEQHCYDDIACMVSRHLGKGSLLHIHKINRVLSCKLSLTDKLPFSLYSVSGIWIQGIQWWKQIMFATCILTPQGVCVCEWSSYLLRQAD